MTVTVASVARHAPYIFTWADTDEAKEKIAEAISDVRVLREEEALVQGRDLANFELWDHENAVRSHLWRELPPETRTFWREESLKNPEPEYFINE